MQRQRDNFWAFNMDIKQQAADQAVQHTTIAVSSKLANGMTFGGSATAFIGGLTLNEFAIIFGMVIGLLGFILQVYQTLHKRQLIIAEKKLLQERAEREKEEHAVKMGLYL